jgi:hypothetical protein
VTTLLDGISTLRARVTIIDITGVRNIDQNTANSLMQAINAARPCVLLPESVHLHRTSCCLRSAHFSRGDSA